MKDVKTDSSLDLLELKVHRKPVLVVVGTRPEAIKLSPVIAELKKSEFLRPIVVSTGQHGDILDSALRDLYIIPDFELSVMRPNQTLSESAARVLSNLNPIYIEEKVAATLVQGDTTSALMGALSSFYNQVPIGHIEAGLRTDNLFLPFPEEANRRLISVITSFHFTPTENATKTLIEEGVDPKKVIKTGNTGIDALLQLEAKLRAGELNLPSDIEELSHIPNLVLVTCHRRETFGQPLRKICKALSDLALTRREINIAFPVHPNPNVKDTVEQFLGGIRNVTLLPPLPYSHFVSLLANARVVITDSGGVQEEAPSLGKRTIVLRELTERGEAVTSGMATMVGANSGLLVRAVLEELDMHDNNISEKSTVFGDGSASKLIVKALEASIV